MKHKRYVGRHVNFRKFTSKVCWIKRKYGEAAKEYFLMHPECEDCGENRMVCLALHHKQGKQMELFEVVCHNCHSLCHGGSYTLADVLHDRDTNYRVKGLRVN